jgi:hypothetical protein
MDTTNPTTTVDRTESYTDAVVETDAAQDGTAVATTTDAPTTKPTTKAATEEDKAPEKAEHAESAEKDEAGKAEAGCVDGAPWPFLSCRFSLLFFPLHTQPPATSHCRESTLLPIGSGVA